MATRRRRRTEVESPPQGADGQQDDDLEDEEDDAERARLGDLVALADSTFADYTWHVFRQRSPEDMARTRSRQQSVFATTITGPIDMTQLRATVGGGVFTLWGYLGGKLTRKIRFEMEGPPIYYAPPSVAPAVPVAPAGTAPTSTPNGTDPVLLGVLQTILKTQEAIATRLAQPAPQSGFSFREMLALSSAMGGRQSNGIEMKDLVQLFQQGIEIGGNAAGGNEKSTLEVVLEKGIPALEKVAMAMSRRAAARPPGSPAPRPRPASAAVVVEDPPAPGAATSTPAEAELTDDQKAEAMRWGATVDALARAIQDGTEPDDFADTLDALLLPTEIDLMLMGETADVVAQLRTAADRYPILNTPGAESFVDRVLASLRDPNPAL